MRNGWNWKYPLSYMYPTHTQLLAKWSSPSIGDRRATGCTRLLQTEDNDLLVVRCFDLCFVVSVFWLRDMTDFVSSCALLCPVHDKGWGPCRGSFKPFRGSFKPCTEVHSLACFEASLSATVPLSVLTFSFSLYPRYHHHPNSWHNHHHRHDHD